MRIIVVIGSGLRTTLPLLALWYPGYVSHVSRRWTRLTISLTLLIYSVTKVLWSLFFGNVSALLSLTYVRQCGLLPSRVQPPFLNLLKLTLCYGLTLTRGTRGNKTLVARW